MSGKIGVSGFMSLLVLLVLLCALRRELSAAMAAEQQRGLPVYLPRECGTTNGYNNRTVVLQILKGGRLKINGTEFSSDSMAVAMPLIYATRSEKLLRVVADDNTAYGEVVAAIAGVKLSVPKLAVLLVDGRMPDAIWRACLRSSDVEPQDR